MKTAVYPGTFDPVTNGHLNIIERVSHLFDYVVIGVAASPSKNTLFSLEERVALLREECKAHPNVSVEGFSGLLVDFATQKNANVLVRGLRTTMDFEYELGLTTMYRRLMPNLESIFLAPAEEYAFLSSTLVREVAIHGGDIGQFVPKAVNYKVLKKVRFQ